MQKTQILILGGAGAMAAYVIHTLLKYQELPIDLILADQDLEKVQQAAQYCNAQAVQLDVSDQSALESALSGVDIVINMVGPYHLHTVNIARTAITQGCHYFDVCDDDRPTLEILALDEMAKEKQVLALIGIGASPGLTNLFAQIAVSKLDTVNTLFAGWGDHPLADAKYTYVPDSDSIPLQHNEGIGTYRHLFQLASERTHIVEKGEMVEVEPFTRKTFYIPGAGKAPLILVAHPEAVGLAKQYQGKIPNIYTIGLLYPSDYGFLKWVHKASDVDGKIAGKDAAELFRHGSESEQGKALPLKLIITSGFNELLETFMYPAKKKIPLLFAVAHGKKDGKEAHVLAGTKPINQMHLTGMCTGAPIAVTVAQFIRGDVQGYGVFTPDALLNSATFLDEMATKVTPSLNKGEDLYEVRIEQG